MDKCTQSLVCDLNNVTLLYYIKELLGVLLPCVFGTVSTYLDGELFGSWNTALGLLVTT